MPARKDRGLICRDFNSVKKVDTKRKMKSPSLRPSKAGKMSKGYNAAPHPAIRPIRVPYISLPARQVRRQVKARRIP
jgi:hypothetical protein